MLEKGYVYRGLKPVNWCFDCGSALAEAEVEYQDKRDPAIDVGFPFAEHEQARRRLRPASAADRATAIAVIWTTTPWTIPANQALNVHPEFNYALVQTERDGEPLLLILAARPGRQPACSATSLKAKSSPPALGAALAGIAFKHPLHAADPFYDRLSPIYLGDYVTLDTGTGIVHSAPAYGVDDFMSCKAHGMKDDDILNPVMGDGRYASDAAAVRRHDDLGSESKPIVRALTRAGALFEAEDVRPQLHALLAPQDADHLPRDHAVVRRHGRARRRTAAPTLRETALRGIEETAVLPGLGQGAPARHDRQPARLDAVAPAPVGRADGRSSSTRKPASCIRARRSCSKQVAQACRAARHRSLACARPARAAGRRRRACTRRIKRHARRLVRFRHHAPDRAARLARGSSRTSRPTCISKARTSIAAGSIRRC